MVIFLKLLTRVHFHFHVVGPATVASAITFMQGSAILTQSSGDEGRTINTRRQIRQQRLLDWRRQRRHRPRIDDDIDKYSTAIIELFEYPRHHDTTRYRHSPTARTASRTQQETRTTRRADLAYMQPTTPLQQHRTCGSSSERAHYI